MKFSLAVKDIDSAIAILGDLYDADSPFCIVDLSQEVPDKKQLIVISEEPVEIANVVFYVSSILDVLAPPCVIRDFPEEDRLASKNEFKQPESVADIQEEKPAVERKKMVITHDIPEPKEEAKVPNKEEHVQQEIAVIAVEDKKESTEAIPGRRESVSIANKKKVLTVKTLKTALTVGISLHKSFPERFIEVVNAETYNLDINLVVTKEPSFRDVVIMYGPLGTEQFERYSGREFSDWQKIARLANRYLWSTTSPSRMRLVS